MNGHGPHNDSQRPPCRNWSSYAFIGFLAVAGFFLLTEHRAHVLGVLPFLILLACPLLHFAHHGRHNAPRDRDDPGGGSSGHRH
jgi:hypothetical protein